MPRKPRNSPNPPGRPRKVPQAVAEKVASGELGPEDAAAVAGVARSTVYEAKRRATKGTPPRPKKPARAGAVKLAAQAGPTPSPPPVAPPSSPASAAPPSPPGSDPGGDEPVDLDPLATLARVQRGLERDLGRLSPELVAARRAIGAVLVQVAKGAEAIRRGRPIEPTADEVQEAIRGAMETAVEHLLRHTREAAAKLAKDRVALFDGLDLGPATVAELGRRVDAMLGGQAA